MYSSAVCSESLRGKDNGIPRSLKYPVALLLIVLAVSVSLFAVSEQQDRADAEVVDVGNLKYEINSLGQASVEGYKETLGDLEIPSTISYESLEYSVVQIAAGAFSGCTSLTSVTIPQSLVNIWNLAFEKCTKLTSITVAESNPNYSSVDGVLFDKSKTKLIQYPLGNANVSYTVPGNTVTSIEPHAFSDCVFLTSVTIPDSVTKIQSSAFENCTSLESVTIPASVTTLGWPVFRGCTSLTSITVDENNQKFSSDEAGVLFDKWKENLFEYPIGNTRASYTVPETVSTIWNGAFMNCRFLTSITVDENNQDYSSDEDGVLFNKQKTKLIQYPIGNTRASYTVPETVTVINHVAFSGCTALTSVTITGKVGHIYPSAFENCTSLESVSVGSSVNSIYKWAFRGCTSLRIIAFDAEEWRNPTIYEDQFSLGTEDKPVSAMVYSLSNIAEGKLDSYKGNYTNLTYLPFVSWTITFDANGGTPATQSKVTDRYGVLETMPTATRDRYAFGGWYTQKEGGEEITAPHEFTQDSTVYAHWDEIRVTNVTLDKTSATLEIGKTVKLVATVSPSGATFPTVTWTSSDDSIAKVSSDGTVTAVKTGTVTIKATADGKEAVCIVTVNAQPAPSSGGGIPVIAIVGAVIAIIAVAGAAVFLKKR